ncbi:MAG: hypothetical protein V1800_14640 [Candidatus Latescibacterota bacterium]
MAQTRLRLFLEEEIEALSDAVHEAEEAGKAFWLHPEQPALSVWVDLPRLHDIPEPMDGSITERALYDQLMGGVRSALESSALGFSAMPVLYPHDRHYTGPAFGTHFLTAVLGAEVSFAKDTEQIGWNSWAKPLIQDVSGIRALEDIDVAQSPVLQAILSGMREMAEIVRGRVPVGRYAPTNPLDFAADVIGQIAFYELVAADPEGASALVDVCLKKWMEMMALQEAAAGVPLVNCCYIPGIRLSDMMGPYLSPTHIRTVLLPFNRKMAALYGSCAVDIGHQDRSLLADYLTLDGLRGLSVPADWPMEPVVEGLAGKGVLQANYNWHFHKGKRPEAPVCIPWEDCCRQVSEVAGKLRVLAGLSGWGDTPQERRDCVLSDLEDLRSAWDA